MGNRLSKNKKILKIRLSRKWVRDRQATNRLRRIIVSAFKTVTCKRNKKESKRKQESITLQDTSFPIFKDNDVYSGETDLLLNSIPRKCDYDTMSTASDVADGIKTGLRQLSNAIFEENDADKNYILEPKLSVNSDS